MKKGKEKKMKTCTKITVMQRLRRERDGDRGISFVSPWPIFIIIEIKYYN
jgi:hypothetical protein